MSNLDTLVHGLEVSRTLETAERLFVLRYALRIGADVVPCFQALLWRPHCHSRHHLVLLQAHILTLQSCR